MLHKQDFIIFIINSNIILIMLLIYKFWMAVLHECNKVSVG